MTHRPQSIYCDLCYSHTTHIVTEKRINAHVVEEIGRCKQCGAVNRSLIREEYDPRYDQQEDA